jgi:hypothetical protein
VGLRTLPHRFRFEHPTPEKSMKQFHLRGHTRTLMRQAVSLAAVWLALGASPVRAQVEPVAVDAAASAPARTAFVTVSDGVIGNSATGLLWTAADSNSDVDWNQAQLRCKIQGDAWRLPSVAELSSLYDPTATVTVRCGSSNCKVPEGFKLTSARQWTRERYAAEEAWSISLSKGNRATVSVHYGFHMRALCVRQP